AVAAQRGDDVTVHAGDDLAGDERVAERVVRDPATEHVIEPGEGTLDAHVVPLPAARVSEDGAGRVLGAETLDDLHTTVGGEVEDARVLAALRLLGRDHRPPQLGLDVTHLQILDLERPGTAVVTD